MRERRPDEPLTDASLDREIEAAVAVDPSPEFLARVRARVGSESIQTLWWRRREWVVPATAVAMVAIAVAVVTWLGPRPGALPEVTVTVTPLRDSVPIAPRVGAPERASRALATRPRFPRAVARVPPVSHGLPEVVVSDNEIKGFALLITSLRQREVSLPAAQDPNVPVEVDEMPELFPVTVDSIEIEPILELVTIQQEGERP
jgi:hypothetical protein